MLGGVLSTLIYLDEKRWRWLVGGGIMTGLALGPKLLPAGCSIGNNAGACGTI